MRTRRALGWRSPRMPRATLSGTSRSKSLNAWRRTRLPSDTPKLRSVGKGQLGIAAVVPYSTGDYAMPRASKWAAALDATESEDIRSKRLSACTTAARKELLAASFRAERRCRRTRLLPTQAPMTPLPHRFYRSFTMLGLSCESQRVTNMARTAPEKSNFFVRSNYAVGVVMPDRSAVEKQP